MNDIKLIALDLDRTTLTSDGKVSKANKEALIRAMNDGIHVCIASGRAFDTLPASILEIPGIEYAITSNGAAIYRIEGKECIRSFTLTERSVKSILDVVREESNKENNTSIVENLQIPAVTYEAFIRGKAYAGSEYVRNPVAFGATMQAINYVKNTRTMIDDIEGFIIEHINELDSIDIIVNDEIFKNRLIDKINSMTNEVYITSSIKQLIEISYKDAGKKSGVKFLSELLGVSRNEIVAFGDADNDIDMIEYAGLGVAMDNASDYLKEKADYITLHHDSDGVAYVIEKLLNGERLKN